MGFQLLQERKLWFCLLIQDVDRLQFYLAQFFIPVIIFIFEVEGRDSGNPIELRAEHFDEAVAYVKKAVKDEDVPVVSLVVWITYH